MKKIKLAKWERDLLPLSLITTKRQAKSIVLRNERVLIAAKENKKYNGGVGCPHCKQVDGPCSGACKWFILPHSPFETLLCLDFKFNGILPRQVRRFVGRSFEEQGVCYGSHAEGYRPTKIKNLRNEAIKFLKAHILWGKRMMDGTYKEYAKQEGIS